MTVVQRALRPIRVDALVVDLLLHVVYDTAQVVVGVHELPKASGWDRIRQLRQRAASILWLARTEEGVYATGRLSPPVIPLHEPMASTSPTKAWL